MESKQWLGITDEAWLIPSSQLSLLSGRADPPGSVSYQVLLFTPSK